MLNRKFWWTPYYQSCCALFQHNSCAQNIGESICSFILLFFYRYPDSLLPHSVPINYSNFMTFLYCHFSCSGLSYLLFLTSSAWSSIIISPPLTCVRLYWVRATKGVLASVLFYPSLPHHRSICGHKMKFQKNKRLCYFNYTDETQHLF